MTLFSKDPRIRHPEIEYVQYKCKKCKYIFKIQRTKDNRIDFLSLVYQENRYICPKCKSKHIEYWNPERSLLKTLFQKKNVHTVDGAIVVSSSPLFAQHYGVYVESVGIISIPPHATKAYVVSQASFSNAGMWPLPKFLRICYVACNGMDVVGSNLWANRAFAAYEDAVPFHDATAFIAWCITGKKVFRTRSLSFAEFEYLLGLRSDFTSWLPLR